MRNQSFWALGLAVLILNACAAAPDLEARRQAREADIADILSQPLDQEEFGKTKRCLSEHEYQNFRALDDKRILFEGRRDKLWINILRTRCPDLRHGTVLRVKSFSGTRICDLDTFQVGDWFDWPWYRRWPWHWGGAWGTGVNCSFGKFQPVTETQAAEIEAILKSR